MAKIKIIQKKIAYNNGSPQPFIALEIDIECNDNDFWKVWDDVKKFKELKCKNQS